MATPDLILLHVPWALLGHARTRVEMFRPSDRLATAPSVAPLVFTRDGHAPVVNEDDRLAELFVAFRTSDGTPQRLWELPVPIHGPAPQTLRFQQWGKAAQLVWPHAVNRPASAADAAIGQGTDVRDEPGAPLYRFLQEIRGRMLDFETTLSAGQDPWTVIPYLWLEPDRPRDPTMDVLVRHAREHRARWDDIAEHPRRVLNRRRELVPLSRVQELDVQCMQWLSRQPGETLAERAGGRQRIMALARYDNRNTLENRVFLDLMVRTVAAARDYLAMNRRRTLHGGSLRTSRLRLVETYQRECQRIQAELAEQGVHRESEAVQPNYVLLHDQRYRHVWTARQEIIRRERAMDELWRWQRRSWAEFCKAVLAVSLIWISGSRLAFASPLFVRGEHQRGEWLIHDDPMVVVAHPDRHWVVELLSGRTDDVPMILRELGASAWLRYADLHGGDYRYLAVWAVHGAGAPATLRDLVDSANDAVQRFLDLAPPAAGFRLAGGIVLLSIIESDAEVRTEQAEFVSGCAFGPHESHLPQAIQDLGEDIDAWIGNPA